MSYSLQGRVFSFSLSFNINSQRSYYPSLRRDHSFGLNVQDLISLKMAERNLEPRELNTHPNFKIVHPSISSAKDIYHIISPALCNQLNLVRRTTPFESKQSDYKELQEIEVYWPDIDRVYYIKLIHFLSISIYQMVFRMDYNGTPLYVQLIAKVRPIIFRYWRGLIFVSRDANLFMKLVLSLMDCDKAPIYQSLAEDGIYAEEIEDEEILFSTYARMTRKTLPTLQYLCCETVYLNEILRAHSFMLPIILKNTLDDFIKTNEAIEDYVKMSSYPYKSRFSLDKLLEIIMARKNTLAAQN